ncbi:MAG: UDP-glucose 4-epimerase GalE [Pirellulaceae bacterium]|nr:UDP-glucose 4-epimerase GalE [Pirellulaceae bacterium]
MNVLVAGGAGYIGSHTVKLLKATGHNPVVFDNLCRGHQEVTTRLGVPLVIADLADTATLAKTLREYQIDIVMHFAAYAYVDESVKNPLMYYHNNVSSTVCLLQTMLDAGVNKLVFSSSCAIYGDPETVPITEESPKRPLSPYGHSKWIVEQILQDLANARQDFRFAALRYFNVAGCALDGTIGEDHDPQTRLIPVILQSILGRRDKVMVYGTDYPTPDGTNIRDYIHVDDLADAHVKAMEKLDQHRVIQCNLGSGHGFSVRQIIQAVEQVTGRKVSVEFGPRRPGDAVALWSNPQRAKDLLGWEAQHKEPESMIQSAWNWFRAHRQGHVEK